MNPQDIAKKYGATFNSEDITKKYGASFTPISQIPTEPTTSKPQLPLLTKPNGGFGTALKDVATGAGKSLTKIATGTAGMLQGAGQRLIAGFTAKNSLNDSTAFDRRLAEVKATTGIPSLDSTKPQGQAVDNALAYKSQGEKTGGIISDVAQLATPFAGGNAEKLLVKGKSLYEAMQLSREAKATEKATSKITEMISPKATVKEAKLAQTQGRFVEGKPATTFRSGTADKILPSQKTLNATQTIQKNIPNASKMSPSQLYKAVDTNITETATKLRPQMEATPIKPETIQKLNTDWEALKKSQIADAPATEEINVAKRQTKFEATLQKSGSNSHADLWDTRIEYDNSIPENVKKANINSPESLQIQKQEWLDNRAILNDAIDASAKPEFKQMSDMYEAKNGILSKTKVEGADLSKLKQWIKNNPNKATALKAVLGVEGLRLLGIDPFKMIP